MRPIYLIGDIHGQFAKLVPLLQGGGLLDEELHWAGGPATLWFMGDFFDRGPAAIEVIDLVMRLQAEATATRGHVGAILGNHDVLMLAVRYFGGAFKDSWLRNGGIATDVERLTDQHIAWVGNLPAISKVEDRLLLHADATFYHEYGRSIAEVNASFHALLQSADQVAWARLLDQFAGRMAFVDSRPDGALQAAHCLQVYGGAQVIHGHTPLSYVLGVPPESVHKAAVYAGGLCVNIDGGMYLGGPGFVHRLGPEDLHV